MPSTLKDTLEECYPNSLIVEFYRVFGKEHTQKLIEIFGGTSFYIPSTKQIKDAYRRKQREPEETSPEETQEESQAQASKGQQHSALSDSLGDDEISNESP